MNNTAYHCYTRGERLAGKALRNLSKPKGRKKDEREKVDEGHTEEGVYLARILGVNVPLCKQDDQCNT